MQKIIAVIGATGNQGGSVARALLRDPQYKVRALTRNPEGKNARDLADMGAEIILADLEDKNSLARAIEGVYGCFVVTESHLDREDSMEAEVRQGSNIADICKILGVKHLIFSVAQNVQKVLGIGARHMDAKAEIEDYMNEMDLPLTCIIVPFYFENFFDLVKPKMEDMHRFKLEIPMGHIPMNGISVTQVGDCVRSIFNSSKETIHKTFALSADKLTIDQYANILTKHLRPNIIRDAQMTLPEYRAMRAPYLGPGEKECDIATMYEFYQRVDQRHNLATTKRLNPKIWSFEEWVQKYKEKLMEVLAN